MRAEAHAQGMSDAAKAKAAEPAPTPPDVASAVTQLMKLVLVKTHYEKQVGRKVPDKEDFFANLGAFSGDEWCCCCCGGGGCCWYAAVAAAAAAGVAPP